ncbi:RICIN domain-containing protein [Glycomyces sp. NRRL B-16210]|uniref:RICIN domain-containing protein n=1 Tax=Glycomyces sp. NRRL B-16210 TaxID=1463821 RepID=UPI0018CC2D08|nr:RICIN domain-containing protein [Glycomyces sp. NRRL B-16210]
MVDGDRPVRRQQPGLLRASAPAGRVLIGGTGYSQDLRPICDDARFNGTLLSYHHYAFFYGDNTEAGWRDHFETRLGNCASRAILTEYGAAMDTGLNYNDPNSSSNEVRHIRAVTAEMREHNMGSTYWPGIGGKLHDIGYDGYSMFALQGSGTNLSLSVRNDSGLERIRYGWGDGEDDGSGNGGTFTEVVNRGSGKCLDVQDGSTANGAGIIQWDCWGGSNQRWELQDAGSGFYRIVSQASGRCLDVDGASTANGAKAIQWACNSGANQQWELRSVGGGHVEIVARHSGKCLDVLDGSTANGAEVIQWECVGAANQQWSV